MSDEIKKDNQENPWGDLIQELEQMQRDACDADEGYERTYKEYEAKWQKEEPKRKEEEQKRKEDDEWLKEERKKAAETIVINDDDDPELKAYKKRGQAIIVEFKRKMRENLMEMTDSLEDKGCLSKETADMHRQNIEHDLGTSEIPLGSNTKEDKKAAKEAKKLIKKAQKEAKKQAKLETKLAQKNNER